MIISIDINLKKLKREGKNFLWPRLKQCPCCSKKIWGHGFVLFNNLFLKRYRCNHCSSVVTLKPNSYIKKYTTLTRIIYQELKHRLTHYKWSRNAIKQKANHWVEKFITFYRAVYGFSDKEMDIVQRLDFFYLKGINFLE